VAFAVFVGFAFAEEEVFVPGVGFAGFVVSARSEGHAAPGGGGRGRDGARSLPAVDQWA